MPTYCFMTEAGDVVERHMTFEEFDTTLQADGSRVVEGLGSVTIHIGRQSAQTPPTNGWPMECDATGVHPSQVNEALDYMNSRGVRGEFTADGRAVYHDRTHRRACQKVRGFYDRDGGYGDAQRS